MKKESSLSRLRKYAKLLKGDFSFLSRAIVIK